MRYVRYESYESYARYVAYKICLTSQKNKGVERGGGDGGNVAAYTKEI